MYPSSTISAFKNFAQKLTTISYTLEMWVDNLLPKIRKVAKW